VLYLGTPSSQQVRDAMSAGLLGCMTTPAQGNVIPDGAWYACDNGKFGKGWPGHDHWFAWLERTIRRYGSRSVPVGRRPRRPIRCRRDPRRVAAVAGPHD
jgi:hypothetical protein